MPMPLLRLRSDEQLAMLFRNGHDEAFRVIHDRYHQRLFAYTRQMLPVHMDAEDALQDVFLRVYTSLRASDRRVARLRPWLYRAAHNRCIDELRRPPLPPPEVLAEIRSPIEDPASRLDEQESLKHVLADIRRLPAQQRSALLLRELGGAHYADIAIALEISVPAVKSLLVRARIALAKSLEGRETACSTIREELALAYDSGGRLNATSKGHLRVCAGCRDFRAELRGTSRQLAGLVPTLGPLGVLANALGFGGAGGGASAGGGAAVVGSGGALASAGILSGAHVATLITASLVAAGGAVELRNSLVPASPPAQPAPVLVSSPAPSVGAVPSPSPGPTTPPATTPPASTPPPTINPGTAPVGTSTPPASGPSASSNTGPIRQPAITGVTAIENQVAPITAIGRVSITGTEDVSALPPTRPSQPTSSGTGPAVTGTSSSGSGGSSGASSGGSSGTSSSGSSAPASNGSQDTGTESPQTASSSPSQHPRRLSSSSSSQNPAQTAGSSVRWSRASTSPGSRRGAAPPPQRAP